mgnify:FL=1
MELKISPGSPSRIAVTESTSEVVVQKQELRVTLVTARGPQGPSFAGSNFFDTTAIDALTSSDIGKVLTWDGTRYAPSSSLTQNLTIVGGAF